MSGFLRVGSTRNPDRNLAIALELHPKRWSTATVAYAVALIEEEGPFDDMDAPQCVAMLDDVERMVGEMQRKARDWAQAKSSPRIRARAADLHQWALRANKK